MLLNFLGSFLLGLLTPLTAVCVLPLYPGFIAYLSNQLAGRENQKRLAFFIGLLIVAGVLIFMTLLGIIFTTILQVSLTRIINLVSPIAFGLLGAISLLLIFNVNIGKYVPQVSAPTKKNPLLTALLFGLFFGAIIIPCNPGFIAAFFARALLVDSFFSSMLHFFMFGLGIGAPLLVLAALSTTASGKIIGWLIKHKKHINMTAGSIMLIISVYYLVFVFHIFG